MDDGTRALSTISLHACCMLHQGVTSGVVYRMPGEGGMEVGATAPPGALTVARFVAAEDERDGLRRAAPAPPPWLFVVLPLGTVALAWQGGAATGWVRRRWLPGVNAPSLRLAALRCMKQAFAGLRRRTDAGRRELAGVLLLLRDGGVRHSVYRGRSDRVSVEPYCAGRRRSAVPEVADPRTQRVLGEWHTHPTMPGLDLLPPSAADLYQLALAAAKGELNLSYVLAPEGLYECRVDPALGAAVLREFEDFLRHHHYPPARIRRVVGGCEQPLPPQVERLHRRTGGLPALAGLLSLPTTAFHDLTARRSESLKARLGAYLACMRTELGIHIEFHPM